MMPEAMLPAIPNASTVAAAGAPVAAATAAAAPIAPITAVGWKPAACVAFPAASPRRHINSWPAARPRRTSGPVRALGLGDGQDGRNDDGAGMYRASLEGVVEVLAMRRRAVDHGRRLGRPALPRADDPRGSGSRPGIP